jgi:tyrosine-protein kinase
VSRWGDDGSCEHPFAFESADSTPHKDNAFSQTKVKDQMDLRQYIRVLRAHWRLIILAVLVSVAAAVLIDSVRTSTYSARTQLFVTAGGVRADLSQMYQGELLSQQRVQSFARIVNSPEMARRIILQLHLRESIHAVQTEISASVPPGTVVIDITVKDHSPELAKGIADSIGKQFPAFVNRLETTQGSSSPVKIGVTSQAELPTHPVSPKKLLDLGLALLLGFSLGVVLAVVRESLDTRIKDPEVVAAIVAAPIVAMITRDRRAERGSLAVISDSFPRQAEEYRSLRTNIGIGHTFRSIVVSSAIGGESTTTVVANLGIALAQAGYRVVLVDANLRRPALARMLGISSDGGLSDVLARQVDVQDAVRTWRPGLPLGVLPSGPLPPNPSELLGSQRLAASLEALTKGADVVILDSPPLLEFTDAAVVARMTTGVLLVTRLGSTRADQLEDATKSLRIVNADVLGVVLNGMPAGRARGRRNPSRRSGVRSSSEIQVPEPRRQSSQSESRPGAGADKRRRRGAATAKQDEGSSS